MRKVNSKKKKLTGISIPSSLHLFLKEVHSLIENRNELATTESDDLLQCEKAYGGLIEENGNEYSFTFFTDKSGTRNKWEFVLDSATIKKIATRDNKQMNLWACRDPDCECMFSDENDLCFYCDYEEFG